MGNMNRNDHLGAFKDLGRLVRIGRMIPLPLNFGNEAFLGMAVCADIRKLWSAYAALIGKGQAPTGLHSIDLNALIQGLPEKDLEAFKKGFDEESEIVMRLISSLEALPASGADIDLNIDYRGRKVRKTLDLTLAIHPGVHCYSIIYLMMKHTQVKRKRPSAEDMCDSKEEWEAGEYEYMERGSVKIIFGADGKPMTILGMYVFT